MARLPDTRAAETCIWLNARLLERHRYAYLFNGASPEGALAALLPYQNPDGGFGHALEPDIRGAESQPLHVHFALLVLDELGRCSSDVVVRLADYLDRVAAPNGAVAAALPGFQHAPHPPWMDADGAAPPASLLPTAGIAGLLHKNGVAHPWLDRATAFCWQAIAQLEETHPYEVQHCLGFLDQVPDRPRAEREAARLGRLVREQRLVVRNPDAPDEARLSPGYAAGELHTPLDYAPHPSGLARHWFTDEEIVRHLDALAARQEPDGGWSPNWRAWNTATTVEWRGALTILALWILQAYGRLPRDS